VEFNAQATERAKKIMQDSSPDDPTVKDRIASEHMNFENEFIAGLPPELQERFKVSVAETRVRVRGDVADTVQKQGENSERFKTVGGFSSFLKEAQASAQTIADSSTPDDETVADRIKTDYQERRTKFLESVPEKLRDEFTMRLGEPDTAIENTAKDTQRKHIQLYQESAIGTMLDEARDTIAVDPDSLEAKKAQVDEAINSSAFSETEKFTMRQKSAALLEKQGYSETLKRNKIKATTYMGELVQGTQRLSEKYRLPAKDFLTVFSFETGGTFSVDQKGGANGAYLGLIQFGPAEQKKYNIRPGMTVTEQLVAVDQYLTDRGFKPGMSMMDLYSTINAGAPGYNNASDAANGGTPGSVADKVTNQMSAHAAKAEAVLGADTSNAPRLAIKASEGNIKDLNPEVVDAFERLQGKLGVQLLVKSGYRDPEQNAKAGGAKDSAHMKHKAIDIETGHLSHKERLRIIQEASAMGFTGIGVYANNIHLDMRNGAPVMWGPTHHADSVPAWAFAAGIKHRAGKSRGLPDGSPVDFGQHVANGTLAAQGKFSLPDNIDEDPRFINVPFEDRTSIRNSVEGEVTRLMTAQKEQAEAARKATVDSLYNNLYDGKADLADIDEAMKTGLLNSFEERKKAVGIIEDRDKEGLTKKKAVERLATGNLFDISNSEDNKYLNALYGPEGTDAINKRDQNYVQQGLMPLVQKTGAIPPEAVGTLSTLARSTDGRNVTFALQTLNALEELNPTVYGLQVTPAVRQKADLYEALVGTMPDKQLFEMLADAPTTEQRNAREFYRQQAEELLKPTNVNGVKFADQFDDVGGAPLTPTLNQAETEWKALFTDAMSRTGGNQEAALQMANKQYSRVWKKTQIDGVDSLMKYPPELYSPALAGDFSWMTKQIRGELGLTETERVFVNSDVTTAKEVATSKRPSYQIFIQRENGALNMIRGPNNKPLRHVFTPSEDDLVQHEADLRIKSKELELKNVENLMRTGPRGSRLGVPEEIIQRGQRLKDEITVMKGKVEAKAVDQDNSYKLPAQKELAVRQAKWEELISDLETWTGPVEEWPRYKELEAADKALEAAKKPAEEEAARQRKLIGE
jgi:uncharacterized protein YcbK (DUF882 family)